MKFLTSAVTALVFLGVTLSAAIGHAQSSQCSFIRDPDQQAQCRALTGAGAAQCGFIRNADMQAYCRASTLWLYPQR
ncbi:MAG: hypothetical protein EBT56_13355 [Betaproteobacteria bacterium]|nr:hypothetical protein [Betaproteobacteria bacterium]